MTQTRHAHIQRSNTDMALAGMYGCSLPAVWGSLTFDGDLPWGAMTVGWCIGYVSMTVAAVVKLSDRQNDGWVGWPHIALAFLCGAIGVLSGIWVGA